jgi:hypothetical protein
MKTDLFFVQKKTDQLNRQGYAALPHLSVFIS